MKRISMVAVVAAALLAPPVAQAQDAATAAAPGPDGKVTLGDLIAFAGTVR